MKFWDPIGSMISASLEKGSAERALTWTPEECAVWEGARPAMVRRVAQRSVAIGVAIGGITMIVKGVSHHWTRANFAPAAAIAGLTLTIMIVTSAVMMFHALPELKQQRDNLISSRRLRMAMLADADDSPAPPRNDNPTPEG